MARKTVTEEDLGLTPTEEEMAGPAVEEVNEPIVEEPAAEPEKAAKDDTAKPADEPEGDKPAKSDKKPDDEPKMVDVRALQEARAEAREARERAAVMEQRWNDFLATQNKPKKEEEPAVPKFGDDPMAAGEWTQEQLLAMKRESAERAEREKTEREAAETFRQHRDYVQEHYNEAIKTDPAVDEAFKTAWASYEQELKYLGYKGQELQQGMQQVLQNFTFAASQAVQNGQPLAEFVKGIAQTRGWQPQQAPAEPVKPKTDLAAVASAQQRHQSLSDAPGGDAPAPLDAKALAKMSDKEFKAWMSRKGNEQKFDEIMGG